MNANMKRLTFYLTTIMLSSAMLSSCSSSETEDLEEPKTIVNMMSEVKPILLTPEQKVFVNDNNKFTLRFLKAVSETDRSGKSFIYSPLSITYALGMVNDAATGKTEEEIEQTLGFHQGGIKAVNEYCRNLIDNLPKVDNKVTLNIANAIFLNKDYTLKPQFEEDMKTYYDSKAETLDFSATKESAAVINKWCDEKTNGMIPNIIDETDPKVISYLLNAIYFKADWASKFDQKYTKTETFTTENGTKQLPLMHQNVLIQYYKNNDYSAIEMPYGSGYWKMTVILPEEGKTTDDIIDHMVSFDRMANLGLEGHGFGGTMGDNYRAYEVDLKLPRYETSSDTNDLEGGLISLMKKMGINLAFDSQFAEIPNMCNVPVYIDMMRQKAKIKVNEEGSEAAAVTIVGVGLTGLASSEPPVYPKATFHANRPFVYAISEASSGTLLFVGKFTGE